MKYFLYCRKSQEAEDRQILSMPSQRAEAEKRFGGETGMEIVAVFEEAMSAKAPGRPIFNEMMARIEAGDAEGIVAWAPDRLARNSIDGGRIVYRLDTGALRDLKFLTYTFENNSQGKFMLSIMFGQSKYYSDALSENVKRGNRTKASMGWRPGAAPMGYLNDRTTKTIVIDPAYFPLVRKMFDLALTGGHSAKEIARRARQDWHLKSPKRRKGGGVVHTSLVHRALTNPFYAGLFLWDGQLVEGAHQPVVSLAEFEAVQMVIRRRGAPHPSRHAFTYVGLIQCGECGMAITAQFTTNRFGTRYTYYRCTKKGLGARCQQPGIREEELERQIEDWLASLRPDDDAEVRLREAFRSLSEHATATAHAVRVSLESALSRTRSQLSELLKLRLAKLIDDEEFGTRRSELQMDAARLARKLENLAKPDERLKPLEAAFPLAKYGADWFRAANDELKRTILKSVGSNLILIDKKLSVEAARWLQALSILLGLPTLLGVRAGVKTLNRKRLLKMLEELHADETALDQLILAGEVVLMSLKSPTSPTSDDERAEHVVSD
jgi:DNA invertase Pin-like site-specific DNA recombinase